MSVDKAAEACLPLTRESSKRRKQVKLFSNRESITNSSDTSDTLSNYPLEDKKNNTSFNNNSPGAFKVSWYTQLQQLMLRSAKNLVRKPSLLAAHLIISVVLGFLIGALYYGSGNTLAGFQNRLGNVLFICAMVNKN